NKLLDIFLLFLIHLNSVAGIRTMPMLSPTITIPLAKAEYGDQGEDSEYLFDPEVLSADLVDTVPNGFVVRPLKISDYDTGFLDVLSQLTVVGEVSREAFESRFKSMKMCSPPSYYVVVIENLNNGRVVGAATLVIEWKFIHQAGCRGRVEDVVVDKEMRGKKMGGLLNKLLVELAKKIGVYKLSLECKDSLIPFYELFGYSKDILNNFLVQRFDKDDEIVVPLEDENEDGTLFIPSSL
uniref:Glucosamine 6-phosphate N-acetyltransferase n=2 Tax=Haemonchus contortus TaxID=6289 RepID=A0A7I4Y3F4_HAECO